MVLYFYYLYVGCHIVVCVYQVNAVLKKYIINVSNLKNMHLYKNLDPINK